MPYKVLEGTSVNISSGQKMIAPPMVRIPLGSYPSDVADSAAWRSTYSTSFLAFYTCTWPSIKEKKRHFAELGIKNVALTRSFHSATMNYAECCDGELNKQIRLHKRQWLREPLSEERLTTTTSKGMIVKITDLIEITPELKVLYEGTEVGDFIEIQTSVIEGGSFELMYDMPLTEEAFIKCELVLKAMVKHEYLTETELCELRTQAMKSCIDDARPGRYFFIPPDKMASTKAVCEAHFTAAQGLTMC